MHTTGMHEGELRIIVKALTEYESRMLGEWRDASAMAGAQGERAMRRVNDELDAIREIQRNIRQAGGLAYTQDELPR